MLISCVDRIDISHRYIVKLGTATVLMCMIYLLRAARYHALFVPCLDPRPFLTPLSEGQSFSPGILAIPVRVSHHASIDSTLPSPSLATIANHF